MTTVIDNTRPAHSDWGGSISYRVKNCVGSVAINRHIPKRPSSGDADKGTWAHALAAYCLEQGYETADGFRKQSLPLGVEVPPQYSGVACDPVVDGVNVFLAAVFEELAKSAEAELFVEIDVELREGFPEAQVFGRLDAVVWHPALQRLAVFDYKNGVMIVDAQDNDQMQFYTAGLLESRPDWEVVDLELIIVQPNPYEVHSGQLDAVRRFATNVFDIAVWREAYQGAVLRSLEAVAEMEQALELGADPFVAVSGHLAGGAWCGKTFCDAAALCPAAQAEALQQAQVAFQGVPDLASIDVKRDLPQPKELDMERLEAIVENAAALAAYAQACERYLEGLAMTGAKLSRFKVVEKIGRRKFIVSDEDVIDHLELTLGVPRDVATRTQLQTMTEMKKIMKQYGATKEHLDDFELRFTAKESSGLTMAPVSDKREAVTPAAASFGDVSLP